MTDIWMTDIRRTFSAVFRYLPDPAGDIRMIHNGLTRTEVGLSIEEFWFRIDNRRTVSALYDAFLECIGAEDGIDARTSFAAILRHFESSGYIETTLAETTCSICDTRYDPLVGDLASGIRPGTSAEDLPEDCACPGCGTEQPADPL